MVPRRKCFEKLVTAIIPISNRDMLISHESFSKISIDMSVEFSRAMDH